MKREYEEVLKIVNEIFKDLFDDDSLVVDKNTTSNDIEDWDSLMHINLIIAIEKRFNIKFLVSDIKNLDNVGNIIDSIIGKSEA